MNKESWCLVPQHNKLICITLLLIQLILTSPAKEGTIMNPHFSSSFTRSVILAKLLNLFECELSLLLSRYNTYLKGILWNNKMGMHVKCLITCWRPVNFNLLPSSAEQKFMGLKIDWDLTICMNQSPSMETASICCRFISYIKVIWSLRGDLAEQLSSHWLPKLIWQVALWVGVLYHFFISLYWFPYGWGCFFREELFFG